MKTLPLGTSDVLYSVATIFFTLSLISERISNLIKLYVGDMQLRKTNKALEKDREGAIMITAICTGIGVAILSGADLFHLLKGEPLRNIFSGDLPKKCVERVQAIIGFILSGIFISLGSKFWHDMLDIVLEFSNLKKYQAENAADTAKKTEAEALNSQMKVVDVNLKAMSKKYAGFSFNPDNSTIQLKFDKDTQLSEPEKNEIKTLMGKASYNIQFSDNLLQSNGNL